MKFEHDLQKEDLEAIGGIVNGVTCAIHALRESLDKLSAKKLLLTVKAFGLEILRIDGGLQ